MITEQEVITRIQGLSVRRLYRWVGRGWVDPTGTKGEFQFQEVDVARLDLIRQLKNDMAVNNAAIPIVLSLIDQLHGVRYELRSLAKAIEKQHVGIQAAILNERETIDKQGKK